MIQFSFKRKKSRPRFNKDCGCSLFLTAADSGRERETDTLELLVVLCAPWWRWCVVWCGVVWWGVRRHSPPGTLPWLGLVEARHNTPLPPYVLLSILKQHNATNNQRIEYQHFISVQKKIKNQRLL